jgi:hypothetical protein
MNLFHGLLIEDILDTLMQNLEPMDATCLARTCWAEYARQTRLRLSPYPLRKTLRRVSRAGHLTQFQFMHKDWEIPFDDIIDAARRTSNVTLFTWACDQAPPRTRPSVLLPAAGGGWRSLALFNYYRILPHMGSYEIYDIISEFDRSHGEAQLFQYLSSFTLEESTQEYMIRRTARNRHVFPVESILDKAVNTNWMDLFGAAIAYDNLPVVQYVIERGKLTDATPLLQPPLVRGTDMKRLLETIRYLVVRTGIPWSKDVALDYVRYAEDQLRAYHAPFNPNPVYALLDLGMPVCLEALRDTIEQCLPSMGCFLWVCENHKRTQ